MSIEDVEDYESAQHALDLLIGEIESEVRLRSVPGLGRRHGLDVDDLSRNEYVALLEFAREQASRLDNREAFDDDIVRRALFKYVIRTSGWWRGAYRHLAELETRPTARTPQSWAVRRSTSSFHLRQPPL
jgi:hypothetical protein